MQHYYRVQRANGHVTTLHTYSGWDEVVAEYGDNLIGEVNGRGVLQRLHTPSKVKTTIDLLLRSRHDANVEEITHAINKLRKLALPDYRFHWCTMTQLNQDYYNEVIIPSLFPEDKYTMSEPPMLHRVFADLFFPEPINVGHHPKGTGPQVMPEIVKVVAGKQVVDTDVLDKLHHCTLPKHHQEAIASAKAAYQFDIPLSSSDATLHFEEPTLHRREWIATKTQEIIDQIGTNLFGKDWQLLRTNVNPPVKEKTAYELWLEDGNIGKVEDFLYEASRTSNTNRGPDFKETAKYFYHENGKTKTVVRSSNEGDYSIATYPVDKAATNSPDIKGVILRGSKLPVEVADREINSKIVDFVEAQFPEHIQAEVLAKIIPGVYKPEERKVEDIVPEYLSFIGTRIQMKRDEESRIAIDCNTAVIADKFLKFLERCDETQLNTITPSRYDREHFDKIYTTNREAICFQLGAVLTPHLECQGVQRSFMVDGTEANVFRVLCQARSDYRPLVTVRFNKGFFNIELH